MTKYSARPEIFLSLSLAAKFALVVASCEQKGSEGHRVSRKPRGQRAALHQTFLKFCLQCRGDREHVDSPEKLNILPFQMIYRKSILKTQQKDLVKT